MWSTIIPDMEITIKRGSGDSVELIDVKTDLFRENEEAEVIVA